VNERQRSAAGKVTVVSAVSTRVVASTQSFKYQYKYQYLSLNYQYQYQYQYKYPVLQPW